jgi:hypothetical protein
VCKTGQYVDEIATFGFQAYFLGQQIDDPGATM